VLPFLLCISSFSSQYVLGCREPLSLVFFIQILGRNFFSLGQNQILPVFLVVLLTSLFSVSSHCPSLFLSYFPQEGTPCGFSPSLYRPVIFFLDTPRPLGWGFSLPEGAEKGLSLFCHLRFHVLFFPQGQIWFLNGLLSPLPGLIFSFLSFKWPGRHDWHSK